MIPLKLPPSPTASTYDGGLQPPTSVVSREPAQITPFAAPRWRRDPPVPLVNAVTCGYTSGLWYSPFTCATDFSCYYFTTPISAPAFGCCTQGAVCSYLSTCLDYGAPGNVNTYAGEEFQFNPAQFLCGSAAPYCSTLVLYGSSYAPGSTYSFLSYTCQVFQPDTNAPLVSAYQTTIPTTLTSSSGTFSTSTSTVSPSPSTVIATVIQSVPTSIAASAPSGASGASASTATPDAKAHSSNIGIGIGVGVGVGVVVLGLVLAGLYWCFRRNKRNAQSDLAPYQGSQQVHYGSAFDKDGHPLQADAVGPWANGTTREKRPGPPGPFELTSLRQTHELGGSE